MTSDSTLEDERCRLEDKNQTRGKLDGVALSQYANLPLR